MVQIGDLGIMDEGKLLVARVDGDRRKFIGGYFF